MYSQSMHSYRLGILGKALPKAFTGQNSYRISWLMFVYGSQGQIVSVALSFLRNFGISGTSGVLGAISAGIGSLAGDKERDKERQQQRSEREITGLGAGLAEGGQSLASGWVRGMTGLVNKPMQGASQSGVSGGSPFHALSIPIVPLPMGHPFAWN